MNKKLSYPYNLFVDIYGEPYYGIETRFDCNVCAKLINLIENMNNTISYHYGDYISKHTLKILVMHYRDKLSYREISLKEGYKNNYEHIRQIVQKALRTLRRPYYREYLGYGRIFKCYDHGSQTNIHPFLLQECDDISSDKIINSLINDYYNDNDKRKMKVYLSEIVNQLDVSK